MRSEHKQCMFDGERALQKFLRTQTPDVGARGERNGFDSSLSVSRAISPPKIKPRMHLWAYSSGMSSVHACLSATKFCGDMLFSISSCTLLPRLIFVLEVIAIVLSCIFTLTVEAVPTAVSMTTSANLTRKLNFNSVPVPNINAEWRVSYKRVDFMKTPKFIAVVNNSFPGPTLRVRVGQLVRVTVYNSLRQETSIHWHGIRQWGTPWSDGK